MAFDKAMKDRITVIKKGGETFEDLKASVQRDRIYTMHADVLVEPGDLIQRKMSNGGIETFEVIDPGFYEAHEPLPANYQMKVRKMGTPEAEKAVSSITYNFHDSSNIQIGDHNVQNVLNVLQDLVEKIDNQEVAPKEKEEAKKLLATFLSHPVVVSVLGGAGTELTKQLLGG